MKDEINESASVTFVNNPDEEYEATIDGIDDGAFFIVHTYSGPGYKYPDCLQVIPSMTEVGPSCSYADWPPLLLKDIIEF